MIHRPSPLVLAGILTSVLALVACDGNTSDSRMTETVGSAGATISVTSGPLAGTTLTIPANAVPDGTAITIDRSATPDLIGFEQVGPGANFAATAAELAMPASARLPFDPASVPMGVTAGDVFVIRQTDQGRRIVVTPDAVDLVAGTVDVTVDRFAAYQVTIQRVDVPAVLANYLPLIDGDIYEFDSGIVIGVGDTIDEPNLEGLLVSRITVFDGRDDFGFYLRRDLAETLWLGDFSSSREFQNIVIPPLLWLPETARPGEMFEVQGGATVFEPFGSPIATDVAEIRLSTALVSQGRLDTPLGRFSNVLEIALELRRTDSDGEVETRMDRLWLARGIGPVQVELDGPTGRRRGRLVSGLLGGLPIAPQ